MKQYNLSQIMKSAHRKFRSVKGEKSFSECLKSAWMFAKLQVSFSDENIAKKDREFVQAQNAKFEKVAPSKRSSYDDLSIPASAYYNANSTGRFGSHLSTIKDTDMKIVLKVSLREAKRASEAIRDNWHLRKGFNQVETNVWEADSEFWGNLEDEDNVDELKFLVENQFGFWEYQKKNMNLMKRRNNQ